MKPSTKKRRKSEWQGRICEWVAILFLLVKGYHILAHRYKTPAGEIDIIAKRAQTIAVIEVKFRQDIAGALTAVTPKSQYRIANACRFWLGRNGKYSTHNIRFDIIAFAPWKKPVHLHSAFEDWQ